ILTSDHGEGRGNHDELSHGLFIYDSTIHVPLLISGPGLATGKEIQTQTRAIDVMPTALALTGVALPSGLDGRSLLPLIRGENWQESDAISESLYAMVLGWHPLFSVRNSRWKYVDASKPELYDLAKDPGETTNVVEPNQAVAHQFAEKLKPLATQLQQGFRQAQVHDPDLEEKLKSLGYLSGSWTDTKQEWDKLPDPKDKIAVWKLYEQSLYLMLDQKQDQARALLEQAVKIDSHVGAMFDLLARLSLSSETSKSIEYLKQALQIEPDNAYYHHKLATCYRRTQQFQAAVEEDQIALRIAPQMEEALIGLGTTYLDLGRPKDALLCFQKVMQFDPQSASAAHESGTAFRALGDAPHAEQFYSKSVELNPNLPDSYNALGVMRAQNKDYPGAEQYFYTALKKNPQFVEAYFNLGITYDKQNRVEDARKAFQKFLQAQQNDPRYGARVEKARLWLQEHGGA
ncbi:MAG TPA: tetratricopeptide repeat protein, partial [Acidobacteriota bacterium]|nr:tetratricopeptide repeat protein [Acidobacteriota bacterium]